MSVRISAPLRILALAAAAVASLGGSASATIINGTVGGGFRGVDYAGDGSGSTLATTSQITFLTGAGQPSSVPVSYMPAGGSNASNTLCGPDWSASCTTSLNPLTQTSAVTTTGTINLTGIGAGLTSIAPIDNFLTFLGTAGLYDFELTGLYVSNRDSNGSITIGAIGQLIDESSNYTTTSALAIMTFNQSGNTGAVSGSFTLGSPPAFIPPPSVPEPASLALLGVGLLGIGAARRRR